MGTGQRRPVESWAGGQTLTVIMEAWRGYNHTPEKALMANDAYKRAFDGLLEIYVSLGGSAETIVHQLKKIANADGHSKLIRELRNLEKKRLELLDQLDNLAKSI